MKKIIVILVIILSAVMFLGIKYQKSSLYDPREIEKVNKEMRSKFSSLNNEEVVQGIAQVENNEVIEDLPPQIEIISPSKFNDGDTIESDMIHLKFSDDNQVIKATINDQEISTEEIQITTEGIYIVEIQDDTNKMTMLTFILQHKPKEPKITTTSKTTTDKKASTKAANEQAAREKAAREKAAREKAAREKAAREKAAREQVAREKAAREKAAREQAAKEQAEKEQAKKEQAEREQAEREQAAREQAAKEQAEKEKAEKEKAEKERAEKEKVEKKQVEQQLKTNP